MYEIVEVKTKDLRTIDEIIKIAQSHYFDFKQSGYLTSSIDSERFIKFIEDENKYIFVVKMKNEIVGYTMIDSECWKTIDLKYYHIENEKIRKKIETSIVNKSVLFFNQTAVKKEYQRSGIGKFVHDEVFKRFPNHSFLSHVLRFPIENAAMLKLKQEIGFDVVSEYVAREGEPKYTRFNHCEGYHGVLMLKQQK